MIWIGCHLSIAHGYKAMGEAMSELGGDCFAFFTRNPRGGSSKAVDAADAAALNEFCASHDFGPLVAHAPYTMNLCSDKDRAREYAEMCFSGDLAKMELFPGNFFNFHPGSSLAQDRETCMDRIAEIMNRYMKPEQRTTVLLETMAGKGSEIGRTFEEIREILDWLDPSLQEKAGVCLDTCHVWDGGYDIRDHPDEVLGEFDRVIGLDRLKAVHLNDSLNVCGAHRDRHAKLGKGEIGLEALRRIVRHPALQGRPFILETPNDEEGYRKEIGLVKEWMQ